MTKKTKNITLKAIIDIILYEHPSTQDEIAERLGITRRYVTKLLKPLIEKGVVKRAYTIDLKKFEEFSEMFEEEKTSREHAGTVYIKDMIKNMSNHVLKQLDRSFEALSSFDTELANKALQMDFITNNMHEKVRSSVDMALSMNPSSEFSKTMAFSEVASDLERIGDHSCQFANFTLKESYEIDPEMLKYIQEMFETAKDMVDYSMEAFLNERTDLKNKVMDSEERIHVLQKKALNCIATQMAEASFDDTERSTYYLSLSRVVKAFERIGDISIEIIDASREFYDNIPRTTTPERFRRKSRNSLK
ncbi:MAG: winged helix-turn-helix transcriptional regulator [Methanobacterium sp.]|uniref:phosphate signaling complex PhoU family protein n=1 Tax=Methanobacterium sp. TaxID=2164 RepID=UPI003D6619FA|nr:winged helix-turn-helix transcriptional regulator [Methanobacterium sp.]